MIDVSLINRIVLLIVQRYIRNLPNNAGKYNVVNDIDDVDDNKMKDTCGSYVIDIDKITCATNDSFCITVEIQGQIARHATVHRGSQIKPDYLFCKSISGETENSQYKGSANLTFNNEVEIEKEKQDNGCYYSILKNAFTGYVSYEYLIDRSNEIVEIVEWQYEDEENIRKVSINDDL